MIRIAICGSDKDACELTKRIKEAEVFTTAQYDLFNNGNDLITAMEISNYGIIFLDTNVSDPIKFGKSISCKSPKSLLIFTSDTLEHAVDAFDCKAFHYILKNDSQKLFQVLTMARDEFEARHCVIKDKGGLVSIEISDIYYVEYQAKYCVLYTSNGKYKERGSIGKLAERLGTCFIRVHQGFILNAAHVKKIGNDTVTLTNGTEVIMSVRKKKFVIQEYRRFIDDQQL